jgi:hypothetical protein
MNTPPRGLAFIRGSIIRPGLVRLQRGSEHRLPITQLASAVRVRHISYEIWRTKYEVDYFLVKLSPALTFVLTFILVLLYLVFDVERRRRALCFEAGDHRRSPV